MKKLIIVSDIQPPQASKKRETRERVACFLKHYDKDEYLLIEENYGTTIPGGGIDDKESFEQAVKREIIEETGYLHIKNIKNLNIMIQLERYMSELGHNLHSISHFFAAELADDKQGKGEFSFFWEEKKNVLLKLTPKSIKIAWNFLIKTENTTKNT